MIIRKQVIDPLDAGCPEDLWPFNASAMAIEDIRWNAEQGGHRQQRLVRQCEQKILKAAGKLLHRT
jgi:hypothetical protein